MRFVHFLLWICLGLAALPAGAQQKLLTLADLFDPRHSVHFNGSPPPEPVWVGSDAYLQSRWDQGTRTGRLLRVDVPTGHTAPYFDANLMQAAFSRLPGVSIAEAREAAHRDIYEMDAAHTRALVRMGGDLYVYKFGTRLPTRIAHGDLPLSEETFSPDGRRVVFIRSSDLFVVDTDGRGERRLTHNGDENHLNGRLDWVYEEEVYGRGQSRAYWWSPDSGRLAFLRLDETPVPRFALNDDLPLRQEVDRTRYPQAGDPNPGVSLAVVGMDGEPARDVDLTAYGKAPLLLVRVAWAPDSRRLAFQVQDREQTWLDLDFADVTTGRSRTAFREKTPAWVEPNDLLRFLRDGSFVWGSERTGWQHLYRYDPAGHLLNTVTSGAWEVRTLHGIDEKKGWIYFSGTRDSPRGLDVCRVRLDGSGLTRLTPPGGDHEATFDPAFHWFLDRWSDLQTPPQARLYQADGRLQRIIDANPVPQLRQYKLGQAQFLQVKARDGYPLEALLIRPPDFSPRHRYPVLEYTYSGPQAPEVQDAWSGKLYLWHQLLAERGYLIWILDNRTASGKGAVSAWPLYGHFGQTELRDLEDGHRYLRSLPFVDGARIGRWGWSFGGFMTAYAMTHSTDYKMGIAGGTVSDWRDYDSIYTERYMRRPQDNPDGYARSNVCLAAAQLHGRLLLIHGTQDDNVHLQSLWQLVYALQKAGKQFDLMLYPNAGHGVGDPDQRLHLEQCMTDYILQHL